ncbi:NAD(P)-dependent oxidoreductase [Leptolyngbya sp. NK1-12]|uniref:NAD(P)-dependent oxidoreductase n=1 Tax=Leptolyngbya sp. NK1-12 TaxID=2547451 RepID=A0AA96WI18_9CYAN|nr:NAD(P)-dependent oxidoreductase [Leptolyngbya sp. NK1-12]WNZ21701.1 NAD(P)-dependent oxidoreductase [Leptolyngbya sp. NK1-12]
MELTGKTILITGINGLIGRRAAELAMQRGMKVRGLDITSVQLDAEVVTGSVTDPIAAEKACRDADIVLHTAAIVWEEGDMNEFLHVNVGGTINMAKTAKDAGVRCFVNLSSVMVYGYTYPDHVTEDGPFYQGNNPYCKTKLEAERHVMALNSPPRFGVINIRPSDVYGPRSLVWVVRPLHTMQQRKFFLIDGGRNVMNHLYVDNLIDAIFLAIEQEAYGETFNITDGYETTWREYATRLAQIGRLPHSLPSLPSFLIKSLIKLKLVDGSITPALINTMTRPHAYSIEKARIQLGYQPKISLDEGMQRTAEWLQTENIFTPTWSSKLKNFSHSVSK